MKRAGRKILTNKDFERLCGKMMDDPSYGICVRANLDNEFYARFGMSAYDAAVQLCSPDVGFCNQKHRPIY